MPFLGFVPVPPCASLRGGIPRLPLGFPTHLLCARAAPGLVDGLAEVVAGQRSWHPGPNQQVCHLSITLSLCQPLPCQPQDLLSHTFPLWWAGSFPKPAPFAHFLYTTSGEQFGNPKPGAEANTNIHKGLIFAQDLQIWRNHHFEAVSPLRRW